MRRRDFLKNASVFGLAAGAAGLSTAAFAGPAWNRHPKSGTGTTSTSTSTSTSTPTSTTTTTTTTTSTSSSTSSLMLAPPTLTNPTVHNVPVTGGLFNLTKGDHIIVLPTNAAVTGTVIIDGRNVANNIVLIGGEINVAQVFDMTTMKLFSDGTYALYTQVGFTGATGGTFQIQCGESKSIAITTAPIAWNATPAQIKTAINTALKNPNGCFAVDGPSTPGGPWKVVPGPNASLGPVSIIPAGLTGAPALTPRVRTYKASQQSINFKDWLDTLHVEGLLCSSVWGADASDIQTPYADATAHYVNCHFQNTFDIFHHDWVHPDGTQCYLGPSKFFAQNVDFISKGGNGFIGQPRKTSSPAPLANLYDWWFQNVQFRSYISDEDPYRLATSCAVGAGLETDYPVGKSPGNQANWTWIMSNCYANLFSWSTGLAVTSSPSSQYFWDFIDIAPTHYVYPAGLTIKAVPSQGYFCDPAKGQCGRSYISPGYAATASTLPTVTKRLQGETKLT